MWYAIQTLGGEEERTADVIRKFVSSDCLEECFVPKRERLKKFHGRWNKEEEVLFYGYIFAISDRPEVLYEKLKGIPRLTRVLGREDNWFWGIGEKEKNFIRNIGDQEHKISISKILVKEGKKIQVVEGPLKDYVGNVVKVNLHKREVTVRVEFMGRKIELKMGVEMVRNLDFDLITAS